MKRTLHTKDPSVRGAALAIVAAYTVTSIHHIYGGLVDGAPNRLFVPLIMALPLAITLILLFVYQRSGSRPALVSFAVLSLLSWVGALGILHGGYGHAYKDALFLLGGSPKLYYPLNPNEHYPPNDVFFEVTGLLDMVTAGFVATFVIRLLRRK